MVTIRGGRKGTKEERGGCVGVTTTPQQGHQKGFHQGISALLAESKGGEGGRCPVRNGAR